MFCFLFLFLLLLLFRTLGDTYVVYKIDKIEPFLPNFLGRATVILNFVSFSKFYRRHSALVEKYSVSLKTLLRQDISEPKFYGELVYRFRKKSWKI